MCIGIENAINFCVWVYECERESEWMSCIWCQLDSLGLIQIIIITKQNEKEEAEERKKQLFREATWKLIGKVRADLKFIKRYTLYITDDCIQHSISYGNCNNNIGTMCTTQWTTQCVVHMQ